MPTSASLLELSRRGALSLLLAAGAGPVVAEAAPPAPAGFGQLEAAARFELGDKQLPSLAIGVAYPTGRSWSGTWGFADAARERGLKPGASLRAGVLSGVLLRALLLRLADANLIDLDAPIERYLPGFAPRGHVAGAISVQALLSGASGLPAEPPRGSSLDLQRASLDEAAASLGAATVTSAPGARYQARLTDEVLMAQIAEAVSGEPFARIAQTQALEPAGMLSAAFEPDPGALEIGLEEFGSFDAERLTAVAASHQGPAALLATGKCLAGLAGFLLTDLGERVLAPDGRMRRHGDLVVLTWRGTRGASTAEIRVAPRQGVAVIVLVGLNDNASAGRLADYALSVALEGAGRQAWPRSAPLPAAEARRLSGQFQAQGRTLFLRYLEGALLVEAPTLVGEVRRLGGRFVVDDAHRFEGQIEISPDGGSVTLAGVTYTRFVWRRPAPPAVQLAPLIGDYGWRRGYIRIYERDGAPYARLGWTRYSALEARGEGFIVRGGEDAQAASAAPLTFERAADGRVLGLHYDGQYWPRFDLGAEILAQTRSNGERVEGLKRQARLAVPPKEGPKAAADLTAVQAAAQSVQLDIRYASTNNFMGVPLYDRPGAYLQRPAALALARVTERLRPMGLGLMIHDSYRPWFVTWMFWQATPADGRIFTADPSKGSRHNRGAAVDLTLTDLKDGAPLEMTGGYDEMSSRSYPNYVGGASLQRWRRDTLRAAMEAEGFDVYPTEWWHFDFRGWERYPILNLDFDEVEMSEPTRASGGARR